MKRGWINHLTLSTGHSGLFQRPDDLLMRRYRAIARDRGGPVPGPVGLHAKVLLRDIDPIVGGGYWQVGLEPGLSTNPLVLGFLCWNEASSPLLWDDCLNAYEGHKAWAEPCGLWCQPPANPLAVPWLTAIILPGFATDITRHDQLRLGRIEQRLAWALIDRYAISSAPE